MKNKIFLFSFLLFFTALCAGLHAHKNNSFQSFSDNISKDKHLQKSDHQNQTQLYTLSDIQDDTDSDSEDLEKVKFDYSAIVQEYISYFFTTYSFHAQPPAVHNHNYTAAPRYILYHALQIAC